MNFVVFKGERKLEELVERGYGELNRADRKRAEAVLLRVNPHLTELKDVTEGSLIVIPPVPGIEKAPRRPSEIPAADALEEVDALLDDYVGHLNTARSSARSELDGLRELLESDAVRERLQRIEEARPYVDRLVAAIEVRDAELEQTRAFLEQLPAARKELAELVKRVK
jgi:hypothetical protein